MSGHTKGPWTAVQGVFWTVEALDGQRVANTLDSECLFIGAEEFDQSQANANLIAAAPDLLDALENLLWHAEQLEEFQESERGKGQTIEQMYAAGEMHAYMVDAKALIARAKGEK